MLPWKFSKYLIPIGYLTITTIFYNSNDVNRLIGNKNGELLIISCIWPLSVCTYLCHNTLIMSIKGMKIIDHIISEKKN